MARGPTTTEQPGNDLMGGKIHVPVQENQTETIMDTHHLPVNSVITWQGQGRSHVPSATER